MARGHEPTDRSATREEEREAEPAVRPRPELRWVEIREPKHALEIGRNGRILTSHFHEGYDAWQVLLETYEGEV